MGGNPGDWSPWSVADALAFAALNNDLPVGTVGNGVSLAASDAAGNLFGNPGLLGLQEGDIQRLFLQSPGLAGLLARSFADANFQDSIGAAFPGDIANGGAAANSAESQVPGERLSGEPSIQSQSPVDTGTTPLKGGFQMSPGEQTLIIPTQRAPVVYPTTISQIGIAAIVPKGTVLTPEVEKQIRGQYSR
jgi:hypothetical protein